MPIPTPIEIETILKERFSILKATLIEYRNICSSLKSIGANLDIDYASTYSCAIAIVDNYFESLKADLQKEHADNSPVTIIVPSETYKFDKSPHLNYSFRMKLRDIEKQSAEEQESLLAEYLHRIDLRNIYLSLTKQVDNVAGNELRIHINEIIATLGMGHTTKPIKASARNIAITKSTTNYFHNHGPIEVYKRFSMALAAVEKETGFLFGGGVNELIDCLMNLSYNNQSISSRTSFGSRDSIEIYCYQSKYEFRFSHEAFSAIEAFVLVHGCESTAETVNSFRDRVIDILAK